MKKEEIPKFYLDNKEKFKDYFEALENLGNAVKKSGPLDEKTAQLIQLAAAAAIRSEGAVHSHTRRALEAGAKPDEIYHTIILLTSTFGFPTVSAALSWVYDVVKKK
jgi:4-carboxymuconolactone decarboxylase